MVLTLTNKVCGVTGAACSIGLAIAERYATCGAKVALLDINPVVKKQADHLAEDGRAAAGYVVDVTNREAVLTCFEQITPE